MPILYVRNIPEELMLAIRMETARRGLRSRDAVVEEWLRAGYDLTRNGVDEEPESAGDYHQD